MNNIVIAAGYATRLGELTKNIPKPLLKIGNNTILGRMQYDIDRIPEVDEHIITNYTVEDDADRFGKDSEFRESIGFDMTVPDFETKKIDAKVISYLGHYVLAREK